MTIKKKDPKHTQHHVAMDPTAYKAMIELNKEESPEAIDKPATETNSHLKFILSELKKDEGKRYHRMAFEVDPKNNQNSSGGIYAQKTGLTPDHILKKVAGPQGDDLVNQILQARSNIISSFGRPRTSRFAVGYEFQALSDLGSDRSEEEIKQETARLDKMKEVLWNCGYSGLEEVWHPNLSQFLKMITRDGLTFGRFAVEFIYAKDPSTGVDRLNSFRAVDAGTIYRLMPSQKDDKTRRQQALVLLQQVQNKKFDIETYDRDEYLWAQVVGGSPIQYFTKKELVVYNLYPTTNIEFNGYPLTPIDQALNAISTHISITIHNKLYFEHGRAARGMLTFKSDDVDAATLNAIKIQFHSSINSVNNSHRLPVFGIGTTDELTWQPIDNSSRDKEFQFLSDDTARVILGAFQVSPEEIPGYAHLARGSNSQTLSESNNEYQLTASRDVGLRPLIYDIQDFINVHIFPKFDESLSKTHQLVLAGLEDDDPEKESTRLAQDMSLHMSYDDVLSVVEKDPVGEELGGKLPLNPQWQAAVAPYLTVGQIMEGFFGVKGASKDPRFNYYRDPLWLQWQQILLQKAQMSLQNQMAGMQQQTQAMMPQPQPGEEEEQEDSEDEEQEDTQKVENTMALTYHGLSKNITNNHNLLSKMILKRHEEIVGRNMEDWRIKSEQAVHEMMNAVKARNEPKE